MSMAAAEAQYRNHEGWDGRPGADDSADAAPGAQEILDLVHQHGTRAQDLPTVLGIPPVEADELLATAGEEYASSAYSPGHHEADSRDHDRWDEEQSWDDEASDDSAERDEVFGPKGIACKTFMTGSAGRLKGRRGTPRRLSPSAGGRQ